jgi:hypothetical protein
LDLRALGAAGGRRAGETRREVAKSIRERFVYRLERDADQVDAQFRPPGGQAAGTSRTP